MKTGKPVMQIWAVWLERSIENHEENILLSATVNLVEGMVFTWALVEVEDNESNRQTSRTCRMPIDFEEVKNQGVCDPVICAPCAIQMIRNSASAE
jgi:hypothetical protein